MPREDVIDVPAIGEGLSVSIVFQSNMVLHREKPIHVWGWAAPGEKVTVTFASSRASAKAGDDRAWKVTPPTVLQSIGKQLENFTLESVINEAQRWLVDGVSCFQREVQARGLSPPTSQAPVNGKSFLDRMIIQADA